MHRISLALIPKALRYFCNGRSSDLLAFEAFPSVQTVTVVSKALFELTAAGTVQDLHPFPYYAIQPVSRIFAPLQERNYAFLLNECDKEFC